MKTIDQIRRENLELLLRAHGTAEKLAAKVNSSPVYISQIRNRLKDKSGRPRAMGTDFARRIEHACGKPIGWMDVSHEGNAEDRLPENPVETTARDSLANTTSGPALRNRVPLISWARAGEWENVVDLHHPGLADEWIDTTVPVSQSAFALRVRGDSMTNSADRRSLPDGAVVVFDPAAVGPLETLHNRIVLAKRIHEQQATIKVLWFSDGVPYLKPLNPEYARMHCPPDTRIVAVARQMLVDL